MALSDIRLEQMLHYKSSHDGIETSIDDSLFEVKRAMPDIRRQSSLEIEPYPESINPAGFDLIVGSYVAKSDTFIGSLTGPEFYHMKPKELAYGEKIVLDCDKMGGIIYYFLTHEKVTLPSDLEIIIDSKSTTGRLGCMSHQVGKTSDGEQIIAVQPFVFPLKITLGKTHMAQALIRKVGTFYIDQKSLLNSKDIEYYRCSKDVYRESLIKDGLLMTFATHLVYRAKNCDEPIDMDAKGIIDPEKYFELIEGNDKLIMDARTFYLLGSQEVIKLGNVCGRISRESSLSGTGLWSHFAGIIHSGFIGQLTLEVYSLTKRVIKTGNPAGVIMFETVDGYIKDFYNGSYQNQRAPMLPKMFKQP